MLLMSEFLLFFTTRCPVDNGTYYDHTLTQTQRFQLVPFRWIPQNFTLVYLHCNVIVCHKSGNSRCSMGCQRSNRRRRRSIGKEEMHRVTLGPIRVRKPESATTDILHRGKQTLLLFLKKPFTGVLENWPRGVPFSHHGTETNCLVRPWTAGFRSR